MKNFTKFLGRNRSGMLKVLLVVVGLVWGINTFAATITSAGTGNWSDGTKWVGGVVPGSGDDVIIASGHTITVNGAYSCNTLVINAAGANNGITIASPNSLNVGAGSGSITINAPTTSSVSSTVGVGSGSLTCGTISIAGSATSTRNAILSVSTGTIICTGVTFTGTAAQAKVTFSGAGSLKIATGTLGTGGTFTCSTGTVEFTTLTGGQTVNAYTYYNLKHSNTSGTNTAAGNIVMTGTLTTTAGGTFNMSTYVLSGAFTAANSGTLKTSCLTATSATPITTGKTWGGTVEYAASAGSQTVMEGTYNNLTLSNSSGSNTTSASTVTVNGTFTTTSGGTFAPGFNVALNGTTSCSQGTMNASAGVVTYGSTTGGQNIIAGTYYSLTHSNSSGTNTACGNITLNASGVLTTTASGTFDLSTYTLSGGTTFTNGGTIKTSNTTSAPLPTGKTWTGIVEYAAATGSQTIMAGTYASLTSSNSSGTNTASGAIAMTGTLTVASGGTIDMSTFALSGALTVANSGTIKTACLATPLTTGKTWGGTVEYYGAAGQAVMAGTYNNLTLTTGQTFTASGNLTVNGTLTISHASGILDLGTNTLGGTLATVTSSGIIKTTNTSATPIATGKTWTGTVEFAAAAGTQTVMAGTYANLTLSNTSGTNSASGIISINGTLTTTTGGIFSIVSYNLTTGDMTGAGRISSSSGTPTLSVGGSNANCTYSGVIGAGAISLTKTGSGTLTLSGVNTYTGATTINGGTLTLGANQTLTGDLTIANTATTLNFNNYNLTTSGNITNNLTGGITPGTGSLTMTGASKTIGGSAATTLYDLTISGSTTFSTNLTISNDLQIDLGDVVTLTNGTTHTCNKLYHGGAGQIAGTWGSTASSATNQNNTYYLSSTNGIITNAVTQAAVYYSTVATANTDANTLTNWKTGTNNTGASPSSFTNPGDQFIVQTGHKYKLLSASLIGTSSSKITVQAGATLDVNGFDLTTWQALEIGGTGVSTPAAVLLNAAATNLSTISCNVTLTADATISSASTNGITISGIISGGFGLTKIGASKLTLTGTNTYTGATTVSVGVLNIQNAQGTGTTAGGVTVASGAAIELQGGITVGAEALTLDNTGVSSGGSLRNISGYNTWGGTITLSTNAVRINSDAGTLILNATNSISATNINLTSGGAGNVEVSGTITTGTGTLTKEGAGTLTLSGTNTYTGATTVSAGVLNIQNAQGTGTTAGGVSVASGAALEIQGGISVGAETLSLNNTGVSSGGALRSISGNNSWSGTITLTANDVRINCDADALTLSAITNAALIDLTSGGAGSISIGGVIGSGTGGVTYDGSSTLTLSGANTYTGATTISSGTLKLGAAGVITDASSLTVNGTLNMNGFSETVASLSGAGAITSSVTGTPVLTLSGATATTTYSGLIQDGSATNLGLTINGATNNLTLSGANTHTGGVRLTTGLLGINNDAALGTGTFTITTGTIDVNAARTISNPMSIGGNFTFTGTNTLTQSTGAITLTATPSITTTASTLTLGGVIGGAFGLTKIGASGVLVLSGANTFTGLTTITTGTIRLGANEALGTTAAGTSITSGAVLDLNGINYSTTEALTVNGTGLSSGGAIINSSATGATYGGLLTLGSASSIIGGTGTINISNVGTITGAFGLTLGGAQGGTLASILGTGAGTLTKQDAGTWTLSGVNTYTGATTISAGTLKLGVSGDATNSPLGTVTSGTTIASGATLDLNGYSFGSTEGLTMSGVGVSSLGVLINSSSTTSVWKGTIALGANSSIATTSGNITIQGIISGAFDLTKLSSNTLLLSAANTYSGSTYLNAGTVELGIANAINNASDIVFNGGTLSTGASVGYGITAASSNTWILNENSTLNLGTGSHSLYFSASNAASWVSGKTLTITGWTGSGSGGTAGRIFVGSDANGLTNTQLNQVTFSGAGNASILSTGELVSSVMYKTVQNGNWASTSTWNISTNNGSTWSAASSAPDNNSSSISVLHAVTVAANATADEITVASGASITVNSSVTFTVNNGAGDDLSLTGTLTNNGTVTNNGVIQVNIGGYYNHANGTSLPTSIYWGTSGTAGTLEVSGTATCSNVITLSGTSELFNLTWSSSGSVPTGISGSGSETLCLGDFTFSSGSFLVASSGSGSTSTLTIGGNYTINGGSMTITQTTGSQGWGVVNVGGDFVLSSGTLNMSTGNTATRSELYVAGNFTHSGGTLSNTSTTTTSDIHFDGTGTTQTWNSSIGATYTKVNFYIDASAVVQPSTNIITGTSSGTTVSTGGTLIIPSSITFSGVGSFTVSGTVKIANANGIASSGASGAVQTTNRTFNGAGTYEYNGSVAQITGTGLPATISGGLTINNTESISSSSTGVTLSQATTVSGTVTLTTGILTTSSTNLLTVSNTAVGAISSGSATAYINGPLKRSLATSSGTYVFATGKSGNFYPFTFSSYTATTPSLTVEAFNSAVGGYAAGYTISSTEYWTVIYSGTVTAGTVKIERPSSLGSFSLIGQNANLNTSFTSIGGSTSGTAITSTNAIGTVSNTTQYYVMMTSSCPTLSGTITIGPSGTFRSLYQAIDQLKACGYTGHITLELQSDYVGNSGTEPVFPIDFTPSSNFVPTSSKTVTIQPASGANGLSITSSSATGTILLNGSDYIYFNGSPRPGGVNTMSNANNLSIINTHASTGYAIRFTGDATYNKIEYCNVEANPTSSANGVIIFNNPSSTTGNSYNEINYCEITKAATTPTNCIYSVGLASMINKNNIVNACYIYDYFNGSNQTNSGISIHNFNSDWSITNNRFYQTASRDLTSASAYHRVINIYNDGTAGQEGNNFTVTGNTIGGNASDNSGTYDFTGESSASAGNFSAIYLKVGTTTASTVSSNTIKNLALQDVQTTATNGFEGGFNGIAVLGGKVNIGSSGNGNTIGSTSSTSSITYYSPALSGSGPIYGIYINSTSDVTVAYNNIGGFSTHASSGTAVSYRLAGIYNYSTGGTISIINNVIGSTSVANSMVAGRTTSSTTETVYGIYNSSTGVATINSNTIQNLVANGTSSATIYAISNVSSASSSTINSNTISTCSLPGTGSAGKFYGVYNASNLGITIQSNTISSITITNGQFIGISDDQTSSPINSAVVHDIYNNTIGSNSSNNISISSSGTLTHYGVYVYQGTTTSTTQTNGASSISSPTYKIRNNTIQNFTHSADCGTQLNIIGIYLGATASNNNHYFYCGSNTISTIRYTFNGDKDVKLYGVQYVTANSGAGEIGAQFEKNKIFGFQSSSVSSSKLAYFYGFSINAKSGTIYVTNNLVHFNNGSNSNTNSCVGNGIYLNNWSGTASINLIYNTIYIGGSDAGTKPGGASYSYVWQSALDFSNFTTANITGNNNIFINNRSSTSSNYNTVFVGGYLSLNTSNWKYNYFWSYNSSYVTTYNASGWVFKTSAEWITLLTTDIGNSTSGKSLISVNTDGSISCTDAGIVGLGLDKRSVTGCSDDIVGTTRAYNTSVTPNTGGTKGCYEVTTPTLTFASDPQSATAVCYNASSQTTSLTYTASTGSPNSYTIDWNATANTANYADQTSTSHTFVSGGSTISNLAVSAGVAAETYSGTIVATNTITGCSSPSYNISIVVNSAPTITLSSISNICNGTSSVNLPYTATTNSPNQYSIAWDAGATTANFTTVGLTILPASPISITVPSSPGAGTYTGTITVKNTTTGCSSTGDGISIVVNALPTITLGSVSNICNGTTSASLPYTSTTNSPNQYSIAWDAGATTANFTTVGLTILPASPISITVPSSPGAGTYTGTITVKNTTTGCSSTGDGISLTVNSLPTVGSTVTETSGTANDDGTICSAATITLAGTGASTYSWDNSVTNNISFTGPTTNTTYTVTGTDANGCQNTTTRTITVNALPTLTSSGTITAVNYNASAQSSSLTYTASTNSPTSYSIVWSSGITDQASTGLLFDGTGGTISNVAISAGAAAGTYTGTMTYTNANGCSGTKSVTITISSGATVFYFDGTGSMSSTSNWGTNTDGTGTNPSDLTLAGLTFNVLHNGSNSTPSNDASWILGAGSKIIVGDGSNATNFTIIADNPITGTVDVADNATLTIVASPAPTLGTIDLGSTVVYNGVAAQTATANKIFGNLTINNSSTGVTLLGNASVSGTLTLTAGKLTIPSSTTLTLGTTTTDITLNTGGSTNYIVCTDTTAKIQRYINANATTYTFPMGDASSYNPMTLNFSSGATGGSKYVTTSVKNTVAPGFVMANFSNYIKRYWLIYGSTNFTGVNYTITYKYNNSDVQVLNTEHTLIPVKRSGATWYKPSQAVNITNGTVQGSGAIDTTNNICTWSGLTSFSFDMAAGDEASALPIHLLYFKAKPESGKVRLDWSTASETNNDYFTVERSKSGSDFSPVLTVPGAGTSTTTLYYFGYDKQPYSGISYYRLKQTDFDGKFEYSEIESVNLGEDKNQIALKIYPNPAIDNTVHISFTSEVVEVNTINVYDAVGKIIYTEQFQSVKGINEHTITIPDLAEGIYNIELESNSNGKIIQSVRF